MMFPFFNQPVAVFDPLSDIFNIEHRNFSQNHPFNFIRMIHKHMDEFMQETNRSFCSNFNTFNISTNNPSQSGNEEFVPYTRNRLQWFESSLRRPDPQPPSNAKKALDVLNKLPISKIKIHEKNKLANDGTDVNENEYTFEVDKQNEYIVNNLIPLKELQQSHDSKKPECEICLVYYKVGDRIRHLPCSHAFHVRCIDCWLRTADTCPLCRKNVVAGLRRLHRLNQSGQQNKVPSTSALTQSSRGTTERSASMAAPSNNTTINSTSGRRVIVTKVPTQTRSSILRHQLMEQRRNMDTQMQSITTNMHSGRLASFSATAALKKSTSMCSPVSTDTSKLKCNINETSTSTNIQNNQSKNNVAGLVSIDGNSVKDDLGIQKFVKKSDKFINPKTEEAKSIFARKKAGEAALLRSIQMQTEKQNDLEPFNYPMSVTQS